MVIVPVVSFFIYEFSPNIPIPLFPKSILLLFIPCEDILECKSTPGELSALFYIDSYRAFCRNPLMSFDTSSPSFVIIPVSPWIATLSFGISSLVPAVFVNFEYIP